MTATVILYRTAIFQVYVSGTRILQHTGLAFISDRFGGETLASSTFIGPSGILFRHCQRESNRLAFCIQLHLLTGWLTVRGTKNHEGRVAEWIGLGTEA